MPSHCRTLPARELAGPNAATAAAEAFPDPINETAACSKGGKAG